VAEEEEEEEVVEECGFAVAWVPSCSLSDVFVRVWSTISSNLTSK